MTNIAVHDRAGASAATMLSEFEQLLVSNSGEDAFEVALQLLTAKLFDEQQSRASGRHPEFHVGGTPRDVHKRINALFGRATRQWPDMGKWESSINIAPEQLVRCLRPLVGWKILDSDLSHLDAALERLVSRDAKGALGQYFTPRGVVKMCVAALSPSCDDRVIDPACGSGAFLYEAIKQGADSGRGSPRCLGVDLGQKAARVAMLLSHAVPPSQFVVHRGNSIDGREYSAASPNEWSTFLPSQSSSNDREIWGAWSRLSATMVLTNPPFAGEIDDPEIIAAYEAQQCRGANRKGGVGREHLFVERAVKLLAPGGRLAIVVPQGILANSTASYLRTWILTQCRVLAVVGLHPHAFLPYTGVKTSVLFLEKYTNQSDCVAEYPIAFITSRAPGKDGSGRSIGDADYARIGNSLAAFFHRQGRPWAPRCEEFADLDVEEVSIADVLRHDRLDAEYHSHELRTLFGELQRKSSGSLADRVSRSIARFNRRTIGEIDYFDISSIDSRSGDGFPSRIEASDAPSRASYVIESGDVLVSTVRPDRNVVAIVNRRSDVPQVASNGFCLLRANGVAPEILFAYCKTETFRRLLARRSTASMYPAASDRDVLDMPFVPVSPDRADSIIKKITQGTRMMEEARTLVADAVREMETAIASAASDSKTSTRAASSRGTSNRSSRRRSPQAESSLLPGIT